MLKERFCFGCVKAYVIIIITVSMKIYIDRDRNDNVNTPHVYVSSGVGQTMEQAASGRNVWSGDTN